MATQDKEFHIPLAAGLNTKPDPRALEAPALAVCQNAEFTKVGGIQKRKPFSALGTTVAEGGTALGSDFRKLAAYNDSELLLFTKERLYSYSTAHQKWIDKGLYLAPKVTERSRFVRTNEQDSCDRAQLDSIVIYTWLEKEGSTTTAYIAGRDAGTGVEVLAPYALSTTHDQVRVLAMESKFLLFARDGGTNIEVKSIDPLDLATDVAGGWTTVLAGTKYDIAVHSTTNVFVAAGPNGSQYSAVIVDEDATIGTPVASGVTAADRIAVATKGGTDAVVVRATTTAVTADSWTISGTTVSLDSTGTSVGTTSSSAPTQLTCSMQTVQQGGKDRVYCYWTDDNSAIHNWTKTNWVTHDGTTGTQATFKYSSDLVSHAFDRGGRTFVWLGFSGSSRVAGMTGITRTQLQNTYFLYRDDGELVAKATPSVAGGEPATDGTLPGVANISGDQYAWCGVERRKIIVGAKADDYAARAPRDIVFEFDSDEARRTAQIGKTLYVSGGQIMQYDGESLVEVGFHVFPWYFNVSEDLVSGSLPAGSYSWKSSTRWENGAGESERSTTATTQTKTFSGGSSLGRISSGHPLSHTKKQGTRDVPSYEVWRTAVDPATADAPFHLVTDSDTTNTTNPNRYLVNDPTAQFFSTFEDDMLDTDLVEKELHPEDGGVLGSVAPPPATIIAADDERVLLAGLSYDPHAIVYSKLKAGGQIAAFNDGLRVDMPTNGGDITALAKLNETWIVFKENAIYALPGDGFDNTGGGANFGPPQLISDDLGAESAEAVGVTPDGLYFKSGKGWWLLNRAQQLQYIGGPVENFDSDTVLGVVVMETEHQIRCVTDNRILVYDYVAQQWSEWTESGLISTAQRGSLHFVATSSAVELHLSTFAESTDYSLVIETAWLRFADMQGYQRIKRLMVLGQYMSSHRLKFELYRDYDDSSAFQTKFWTVSPTTAGGPLQVQHGPSIQKVSAIKVKLSDRALGTDTPPTGESLRLTSLSALVGFKRGLTRLPAAQKQ